MEKSMLEKQYEEMQKNVSALRETLEAKFSPEKLKEEKDALLKDVVSQIESQKKERQKMVWGVKEVEGKKVQGLSFTDYLKAINPKESIRNKVMTEGVLADGGASVPEEFVNEILKKEKSESIIRQIANIFPMSSNVRNVPRQDGDVTITWTGEAVAKTPTQPSLDRLIQTAKKLACVVKLSDELLEDNTANIDNFVIELVARAMALEEDRVALAGDTGSGDVFDGVLYQAGVNSVSMAGASVDFNDVISLIMKLNSAYRMGSVLVTSSAGLELLLKLKDVTSGQYLWQFPAGSVEPTLWTYPYRISDQLPTNLGTGTDETPILFGNFSKYYYVSDRGTMETTASNSASDIVAGDSAYMNDETWYRFKKRLSLNVALPEAFAKIQIK